MQTGFVSVVKARCFDHGGDSGRDPGRVPETTTPKLHWRKWEFAIDVPSRDLRKRLRDSALTGHKSVPK